MKQVLNSIGDGQNNKCTIVYSWYMSQNTEEHPFYLLSMSLNLKIWGALGDFLKAFLRTKFSHASQLDCLLHCCFATGVAPLMPKNARFWCLIFQLGKV